MNDLIYVSRSLLSHGDARSAAADIVRVSRARNENLGVTGALLYTGTHFVQLLEGSSDSLSTLMRSIVEDNRHAEVRIIDEGSIPARTFGAWAMAYYGSATYVQRYVDHLLVEDGPVEATAVAGMRLLLQQAVGVTEVH